MLDRGLLLIAGAGPQEQDIRAEAGPRVRLLGSREDVPALLNAADGFVLSSVIEGLPLALLEAAAAGRPCVATDAGGVGETGIGLLVQQSSLADGMRRVMEMTAEERDALGAAGRTRVLERYSLGPVVTQWEALYRKLAHSM
jgi:glycosyltransferase involved in cell wall biosynthesis